ncbi:MAG TPA: hypothetical protein VFX97_16795 [Pyrinomonadaceae bacterium]|nr:hypothetical protein [Pyrinomonadaceae bacterium]
MIPQIQLGPDPNQWPEPIRDRYFQRLRQQRPTESVLSDYQQKPQAYAREILGVRLTPDQDEMLQSILDNRYTVVKASHAVGKTFTAAVAESWWFDCWSKHIGYITAPTWEQSFGLTFKQLKSLRRSKSLPGLILERIIRDADKNREGDHYVRALNAEKGEGFQGEHSAPILIVIEEGVGVPKYIWDAIGGLMTNPLCRVFAIGNPTDEATEFGIACESSLYHTMSISALNHPNIKAELSCESPPFPDAVRLLWLYEMLEKECEQTEKIVEDAFEFVSLPEIKKALSGQPADLSQKMVYMPTAYFQGRVLGEFPTQADQQVIPKAWLKFQPLLEPINQDEPEIGCDIARFGDDRTTIFTRRGPCVYAARELRKMDNLEVESALRDAARQAPVLTQSSIEPKRIRIKIDVTGGLGTGPYDHLLAEGYSVVAINSSTKANNQELYRNKRSELWFDSRDRAKEKRLDLSRLKKEIRGRLEKELAAPKYKSPGQKIVEDKALMKKRLGYSPDLADGLNLAFAPDAAGVVEELDESLAYAISDYRGR